MKNRFFPLLIGVLCVIAVASCTNDLNRTPYVGTTSVNVFNSPASIKEALAKVYGGLMITGQDGYNNTDLPGDGGGQGYLRNWWAAQELPTDEAVNGWNDGDLNQYHNMNWQANNGYVRYVYNRVFYEVAVANEFIRQTSASKIASFSGQDAANITNYHNEARFLRALAYWHAMDLFGNVPFTTENDPVGAFFPKQISRAALFSYVESELLDLSNKLPAPGTNEYGRADQGAAWTLLANLYLNAKVYTGTDRNTDCITYCNKVISSPAYSLSSNYGNLFLTDASTTSKELIFVLRSKGGANQYSNMTYVIHAAIGGNMNASSFGVDGGWGGNRTTSKLTGLFGTAIDPAGDARNSFFTDGQNGPVVLQITNFQQGGYPVTKYKNVSSTGTPGSNNSFPDTDFPMFRLGEVYLMYAEAVVRGGSGGDLATATGYINQLRARAYGGTTTGQIAQTDLSLDFILDERARELYWEGHRRTDLIRFGKFAGGGYVWDWKNGVAAGQDVDTHYNLYPIVNTDITANPNLKQNPGY